MPPLDDDGRWDRLASVFERVIGADANDRASLLDQLCGSDHTIRREVEDMLASHDRPALLVERRLIVDGYTPAVVGDAFDPHLPPGTRVGAYRIDSLVGAGGMGDVYRAERVDGMHRQTVALKVLRPGYRTAELVRRFRIEREALARLAHPDIATILDGGALDDGRPYIILQYVEGVPVTTYCERRGLSIVERLQLFQRIVAAVQFAHSRLVVHRDIKPSNILVDRDGTPHLLDFGIAKLLDARDDASLGAPTSPDVRLFTPEYAAPEQVRGEAPTTATDVYALGVLLFELLTGTKPFARSDTSAALVERAVLDIDAAPPSSVVTSRADARRLRGDLDNIVLMALRKEPERRYESAAQFGDDIQRFLQGHTVRAVPDSFGYRLGKLVKRNRSLVGVGAIGVAVAIGFAVTSTMQARRIARERDRAEQERASAEGVLSILTGLFDRANPNTHPGGDTLRVTSLLDSAELQVAALGKDTVRQIALWRAVARMRLARGESARGLALLQRAYDARRALVGANDLDAARIHEEIGIALVGYRGEVVARPVLDSSFHELERLLGERNEEVRVAMNNLLDVTTDSTLSRPMLARILALEKASPSKDPIAAAELMHRSAVERLDARRYAEAVALFQGTLDILLRRLPPEHEDIRTVRRNLALALFRDGKLAQAESLQRAAVALELRLHTSNVSLGMAHEALALTLVSEHRLAAAEAEERAALESLRNGAAPEHWRIWSAQRNLAFIAAARGNVADGLALLDSAITLASSNPVEGSEPAYLTAQRVPFLLRLHRENDAARVIAESERALGAAPTVSAPHRADLNRYAGMVAFASGDGRRAAERFEVAVSLVEPPDKPETIPEVNSCLLGVAYQRVGRAAEAKPLLDAPCERYARGSPDSLVMQWVQSARGALRLGSLQAGARRSVALSR